MKTVEYRTIDKSTWADGPWHYEPDKRQWQDASTGLFCLINRNEFTGSLCGYVGLPPLHPAWGLHYDGVTDAEAQAKMEAWREDMRRWAAAGRPPLRKWWARPGQPLQLPDDPVPGIGDRINQIEVHGGLTLARLVDKPTREKWREMRQTADKIKPEAGRHPLGDAARWLHRWGKPLGSYDTFVEQAHKVCLCFETEPDEPDELWLFGFDCGHGWDQMPGLEAIMEMVKIPNRLAAFAARALHNDVYRDLAYVEQEVISLARQLAGMVVSSSFLEHRAEPDGK